VVDQWSQETRDLGGGPAVSNSLPGRLRPVPEGLQWPATGPGDSDGARGLGGDQMSLATRTHAEGTGGRPRLPGDLGPCPRPRGVNQMSRATWARLRVPAGSTRCPGCLGPGSEGLQGRQALPVHSDPCPRSHGFDQLSRATKARALGPSVSTCCPGHSGPGPRARGVDQQSWASQACDDQQSWASQACARGPAVSTSCPWRLAHVSEGPRGQPVFPGVSGPARGIAGSITDPRRLGPVPKGPPGPLYLPAHSGAGPRACG